jgi:effector-binding domain-containing protein
VKAIAILLLAAATARAGVEVIELKAQPVVERTIEAKPGELAAAMALAVAGVLAAAEKNGLDIAGPPFARYLARGETFVVEVGLPITHAARGKLRGNIEAATLPAGPAATLVHDGPHETLPRAHAELDRWLSDHHRTAAGPRWEIYLTPPLATPPQTRVIAPLAPVDTARALPPSRYPSRYR